MLWKYFAAGVLAHTISKWFGWRASHRDRKFGAYWAEYWPLVLQGLIVDAVFFFAWRGGAATGWLPFPPLDEVSADMAVVVGFMADSLSKTGLLVLENRKNGG